MNSLLIAANLARRTIGTRKGILIHILLPAAALSLAVGLLGSSGTSPTIIGYADLDGSEASRQLIQALERTGRYALVEAESEEQAADMVASRKAAASFVIPAGFEASWLEGKTPGLRMVRLAIMEATVTLALDLDRILHMMNETAALARAEGGEDAGVVARALLRQYGEGLVGGKKVEETSGGFADVLGIGFSLMFLMMLINQSVALIVEDRANQTMARVYAAPVSGFGIALGNFLGSLLIGTLQVLAIAALTRLAFGYDFGVPAWMQIVILECFLLASLGIASAVAGFIRNTRQLNLINSLITTPTCMIGGCFWPVDFMPPFMQKLAYFVPQRWAIEAVNLGASGETLAGIALPLAILLLFAAVLLGFGAAVLRPAD